MASYLDGTVEDQNGIRVAGASVYVYRSPEGLADLEDAIGQPIANPVITDADGYWKAFVDDGYYTVRYLWGGRERRIDANWLAGDPPVGPSSDPNLRLDLAAPTGGTLVNFTQSGVGAVTRNALAKLRESVSVLDYQLTVIDGTTDNTADFQRAHDALPNGGVIRIPRNTNAYRISKVNITNRNITFELEAGATIKKFGSGGAGARAVFLVQNLLDANFCVRGKGSSSVIDLNGEGPIGIGVAGRTANTYADLTVPGTKGIEGTPNSAVFALRSSGIIVSDLAIKNTFECGCVFRNCSDVTVERCRFDNITHYGVEWSYPSSVTDGGTGTMPDLSRNYVRDCQFFDINDWALGTGNGCGVGGGGSNCAGNPSDHEITGCMMTRCQRDVNLEIPDGSAAFIGGKIDVRSYGVLQGSVGLINAQNFDVRLMVRDGVAAPTAALGPSYPDVYAVVISGALSNDNHIHIDERDTRGTKTFRGTDGAIAAGSSTFTSASASFATTDIGRWLGILGAGPSGICHQARITARNSATSVTIERPALTSVSGATYAYGGAVRRGIALNQGGDVKISGRVGGGVASGLPSEPDAAGVFIDTNVSGLVDTSNLTIVAPATTGTVPTGVLLEGALTGSGKYRPGGVRVKGYTNLFVGTATNQGSVEGRNYRKKATSTPPGLSNSFGAYTTFSPVGTAFDTVTGVSFTVGGSVGGGETITVEFTFYYFDGGDETVQKTATATGTTQLSIAELATLLRDNCAVKEVKARSKTSAGSTSATVAIDLIAVGG